SLSKLLPERFFEDGYGENGKALERILYWIPGRSEATGITICRRLAPADVAMPCKKFRCRNEDRRTRSKGSMRSRSCHGSAESGPCVNQGYARVESFAPQLMRPRCSKPGLEKARDVDISEPDRGLPSTLKSSHREPLPEPSHPA